MKTCDNIYFVGMMGAGKTTIGRQLARRLKKRFVDCDHEIEARTGRPISIGALYATLSRLADKGLLTLRTARGEPGQRGRARRYCRLTPRGAEALRHSAVMLTKMMDGLRFAETGPRSR